MRDHVLGRGVIPQVAHEFEATPIRWAMCIALAFVLISAVLEAIPDSPGVPAILTGLACGILIVTFVKAYLERNAPQVKKEDETELGLFARALGEKLESNGNGGKENGIAVFKFRKGEVQGSVAAIAVIAGFVSFGIGLSRTDTGHLSEGAGQAVGSVATVFGDDDETAANSDDNSIVSFADIKATANRDSDLTKQLVFHYENELAPFDRRTDLPTFNLRVAEYPGPGSYFVACQDALNEVFGELQPTDIYFYPLNAQRNRSRDENGSLRRAFIKPRGPGNFDPNYKGCKRANDNSRPYDIQTSCDAALPILGDQITCDNRGIPSWRTQSDAELVFPVQVSVNPDYLSRSELVTE